MYPCPTQKHAENAGSMETIQWTWPALVVIRLLDQVDLRMFPAHASSQKSSSRSHGRGWTVAISDEAPSFEDRGRDCSKRGAMRASAQRDRSSWQEIWPPAHVYWRSGALEERLGGRFLVAVKPDRGFPGWGVPRFHDGAFLRVDRSS